MYKEIEEIISNMDDDEKVNLWNAYCESVCYDDDQIYWTDDINELFYNKEPTEIISIFGNFDLRCKRFKFDGYGCAEEVYSAENIDFDEVIDYIIEEQEDFDIIEIRELLEETEENEEEK